MTLTARSRNFTVFFAGLFLLGAGFQAGAQAPPPPRNGGGGAVVPEAQIVPPEEITLEPVAGEQNEAPYGMTPEGIAGKEAANRGEGGTTEKEMLTPPAEPAAPFFGGSFVGVPYSGWIPPDSTTAVGPSDILVATNGAVRVYDKAGRLLRNNTLDGFLGTTVGSFDPWAVYDPYIGRFWLLAVSRNNTTRVANIFLARSNTNAANGTWGVFTFNARINGGTDSGFWCDYPKLGIDAQAVYVTCNMFAFGGSFQYAKFRVMTKAQLLGGSCCLWWDFWDLREGFLGLSKSFTVQPAKMYGATAAQGEFLINAQGGGGGGSDLEVRRVTNAQRCCIPGMQSAPDVRQETRGVGSYGTPPNARQSGTATRLDTGDARLLYGIWRNGRLSTGQNSNCNNGSCVTFTEINVAGYPGMTLINDWVFGGGTVDYYYPGVDSNNADDKTMVYSRSQSTAFAGTLYVGIPRSTVCTSCIDGPETTLRSGQSSYVNLDMSGRNRWGDYSGASSDPDGVRVWIHGEAASATANQWGTQVAATYGAVLPAIMSLNPSSAVAGSAGFNLFVNGTGFVAGSVVRWNGANRATTFLSNALLRASISAGDVAVAGSANVQVFTPAPGGGISNVIVFPIVNPLPAITSLAPPNALVGSPAFTLTVNGSGFVSTSVVRWNGGNRATTFMSGTQLRASILASDLLVAGTAEVRVFNPAPGGGLSGGATFTILNPVPNLTSIAPTSALVGTPGVMLTVNGSGFVSGSVVRWNGGNRPTTFLSGAQVRASIPASDLLVAGTAQVQVFNPTPGGGLSGAAMFTILNPVPGISSLSPAIAFFGGPDMVLTVDGAGYVLGSVVRWNGSNRATTFVGSTEITATIPASDLLTPGAAQVTVFNSGPGGGASAPAGFFVGSLLTYVVNAKSNDVSGFQINAGNGLLTGISGAPFAAGTSPAAVAASPSGQFLYVANATSNDLSAYAIDNTIGALADVPGSPFTMKTAPSAVTIDPFSQFLYVANNGTNDLSAFVIDAGTGALTEVSGSPFATKTSPGGLAVDPSGQFLYAVNSGSNSVSAYTIDAGTGALTAVSGSPFSTDKTPVAAAVDPSGQFLYVANRDSSDISAYAIDATGALTEISGSPFAVAGGSGAAAIAVAPSGQFLYVANSGSDNVSAFAMDSTTGALTKTPDSPFVAGTTPVSMAVDLSGQFLYAANNASNDVSAYAIDAKTGALTPLKGSPFPAGTSPAAIAATAAVQ